MSMLSFQSRIVLAHKVSRSGRNLAMALVCGVAAMLLGGPDAAHAGMAPTFTEFTTPSTSVAQALGGQATSVVANTGTGGDNNIWFLEEAGSGSLTKIVPAQAQANTSDGVTQFTIGLASGLAASPDGKLWFLTTTSIVRSDTAGNTMPFTLPANFGPLSGLAQNIAIGPDNAMWFIGNGCPAAICGSGSPPSLARIPLSATAASQITTFPRAATVTGLSSIAQGGDGAMWFVENGTTGANAMIGRITTDASHTITEFPLATANSSPGALVAGPDNAMWFLENGCPSCTPAVPPKIGRIPLNATPGSSAQITEYLVPTATTNVNALVDITVGPDGALWFTEGQPANKIGRIVISLVSPGTSNGITEFTPPASPIGIATGPDGNLWFGENGDKIVRLTPPLDAVTVSTAGAGAGTVTSTPAGITCMSGSSTNCSASFTDNAPVTLNAAAGTNSVFAGWSVNGSATTCPGTGSCTFTPTADTAVSATFNSAPTHALSVSEAGAGLGTVSSNPTGISCVSGSTNNCSASFPVGSMVTLTALPNSGSVFTGWSGSGVTCPGTGTCTVTLNADTTVTATFAADHHLTVTENGNGAGTVTSSTGGISCVSGSTSGCSAVFAPGTQVTLTASANSGSIFSGWTSGGCSGTSACQVTVNSADITVNAGFTLASTTQNLAVQATGTGTGTVTSSPSGITCGTTCNASFAVGTQVTLTAAAASGSTFAGWLGGGCSGVGPCTVDLLSNTTVSANFIAISTSDITLVSAILPSSRSVQVGATATVFGTMINASTDTAGSNCSVAPATNVPASFLFQTTDPTTNALTGTANTPVSIAAGAAQSFVLALTPSAPISPTDVAFNFTCANASAAQSFSGLNTLLFSASATPVPDIVALAASQDPGIVDIPGNTGAGAFAAATVNVGASSAITASADTGTANLPVTVTLCQTDPASGACISATGPSVSTTINANATPTFGIFVQGNGPVPFSPAVNRIFVRFKDGGGVTRGSTSVAVRTQ